MKSHECKAATTSNSKAVMSATEIAAMARMAIAAYMAKAKGVNNKQRGVVYVTLCFVL